MAVEIYWSRLAENKLHEIFDYYKLKAGTRTARKIVSEIVNRTIILKQNPDIGPVEELLKNRLEEFRYLVMDNYKVLYYKSLYSGRIIIANVFDVRQNPEKMNET